MKSKVISVFLALVMLTVAAGVFAKQDKVTICHKPGTEDEKTLSVAAPALDAHLGHGDYEGECLPNPSEGCYDSQYLAATKDLYYDGVSNTAGNAIFYNSTDGNCSGGIYASGALVYVAGDFQDVEDLCLSLGYSTILDFTDFYPLPSPTFICA